MAGMPVTSARSSGRLEGKVMLVTGGASGIGRATALACAREGARIAVADTDEGGGEETAELVRREGGEATFIHTDVSVGASVESMVLAVVARYGRLDCAHNNAGISGRGIDGEAHLPTADYPDDRWSRVIAVNLTGVWLCMKHELRQMLEQRAGSIVNTASIAGLAGLPGQAAYAASKHGVVGLTRTAALEYAKQGIRVNCVCPGFVESPMTAASRADPARLMQITASQPVGRLGTPDEIAHAVAWLCSDEASFVTGHALCADGGYLAQ